MNKTKWIIFAVLVIAIFGGIIWWAKSDSKTTFNGDATKVIKDEPIADHMFGSKDQKVILIEYGDYQCPACGSMYAPVKELTTKYQDKVTFIFRNYPLTNIHPNALAAATAAEAAGLQGKYYEMHDKLYETQSSWSNVPLDQREAVFTGYATSLGLDATKFKSDMLASSVTNKISRDRATGKDKFKITGTPTFVLNGTVISGTDAVSIDSLTKKVEDAIAKAYPTAQ